MDGLAADKYLTVETGIPESELKIKGSRFLTNLARVRNREEAENAYRLIQKKYHAAAHNCFAYRIDEKEFRYSDDGEPPGTAGRPLFKILEARDLLQTLAVVTRYFGGTKLGTGGLIRAYSQALIEALEISAPVRIQKFNTITLKVGYDQLDSLLYIIKKYKGTVSETEYKEHVRLRVRIPLSVSPGFEAESEVAVKIISS